MIVGKEQLWINLHFKWGVKHQGTQFPGYNYLYWFTTHHFHSSINLNLTCRFVLWVGQFSTFTYVALVINRSISITPWKAWSRLQVLKNPGGQLGFEAYVLKSIASSFNKIYSRILYELAFNLCAYKNHKSEHCIKMKWDAFFVNEWISIRSVIRTRNWK